MKSFKEVVQAPSALFAFAVLAGLTEGGATLAHADARTQLVADLISPAIRMSYGAAPELRVLLDRMSGEAIMMRPIQVEAWNEQAEMIVARFIKGPNAKSLDAVASHLRRFKTQLAQELPPESKLLEGGAKDLVMNDIVTAQKIAARELALRESTWAERTAQMGERIEFASDAPKDGLFKGFLMSRRKFLLGGEKATEAKVTPATPTGPIKARDSLPAQEQR